MIKKFQDLLQWLFLRMEGLFNAAFGDRINPFYHLGAITFYLFWIVGASGLYLYIFFETGVDEAYSSVIALTTKQWWLGGIMRSVHRYASDAMVLTMMLHVGQRACAARMMSTPEPSGSPKSTTSTSAGSNSTSRSPCARVVAMRNNDKSGACCTALQNAC